MLVVQLPQLPTVSALDGNAFESILFCRFITLSGPIRELQSSQRELLSFFNRSQQKSMSRKLKTAQDKGFLEKVKVSEGLLPDSYIRGDFFTKDNAESKALVTLANSLWGSNGLLRDWPHPAAWGFGCLKTGVLLCLATLRKLDENISKKSLRKYLEPLISQSSFNEAIRILTERHMVVHSCGGLVLATDWESKLQHWLATVPACIQRKEKGDARRKAEQAANRMRVRKQKLTDAERVVLLALPCVVKGCKKKKNHEMEHFPPIRFLKELDVQTNRHFVWSICRDHNIELSRFIKKLPNGQLIPPNELELAPGVDPLRIYSASANRGIVKFYEALRKEDGVPVTDEDLEAATQAVVMVLGLWKAVNSLPLESFPKDSEPTKHRTRKGKHPYIPEQSQLPFHPA
jgi:hypothetical protein